MKSIITIISLVLIFSTTLTAGNSPQKIGTIHYTFQQSPVVTSNGMGEAGVAVVNEMNYLYNPAILGLHAMDYKVSFSGFLDKDYMYGLEFYNSHFSHPFRISDRIALGVAYNYTKFGDVLEEYDYDNPGGTGNFEFVGNKINEISLAAGYDRAVDLAFGVNLKFIDESMMNIKGSGYTFDIGVAASYRHEFTFDNSKDIKFYFNPAIGLSKSNLGQDIDYESDEPIDNGPVGVSLGSAQIQSITRIGFSTEFGYTKKINNSDWTVFSITPAFDYEKYEDEDWGQKAGLEVSIGDALFGRLGYNEFSHYDSKGFSVSFAGLLHSLGYLLNGDDFKANSILSKIDIKYSYAKQEMKNRENYMDMTRINKQLMITYQMGH